MTFVLDGLLLFIYLCFCIDKINPTALYFNFLKKEALTNDAVLHYLQKARDGIQKKAISSLMSFVHTT